MAAGVTDHVWNVADIVAVVEATEPAPGKRGFTKKGIRNDEALEASPQAFHAIKVTRLSRQSEAGLCFNSKYKISFSAQENPHLPTLGQRRKALSVLPVAWRMALNVLGKYGVKKIMARIVKHRHEQGGVSRCDPEILV